MLSTLQCILRIIQCIYTLPQNGFFSLPILFWFAFSFSACQSTPQYHHSNTLSGSGFNAIPKSETFLKKKVLVLDFWNDTLLNQKNWGEVASSELQVGLRNSKNILLVNPLQKNPSITDFLQGEKIQVAQLIRFGQQVHAHAIVVGRIVKIVFSQKGEDIGIFSKKYSIITSTIETKLFDVITGREIMTVSQTGEAWDESLSLFSKKTLSDQEIRSTILSPEQELLIQYSIRDTIAGILPDFLTALEKMTWQGRIIKNLGVKFYINSGESSGLILGDILRVIHPGEEIYDTENAIYLGKSPGQWKGTLEIINFIGSDGAEAKIHTGGRFEEGDLVQLY